MSRPPDVPALLGVLARHDVRYVLVGSVAAGLHGADVGQPGDLDIVPADDEANLRKLCDVLREIEANLDPEGAFGHWQAQSNGERGWIVDAPTPELRRQRAEWRPDPTAIGTFDSRLCSRLGDLDVVPEVAGTYETLIGRAVRLDAWGYAIWVAHVDDLLATLTAPRRAKDVPRVRDLRAIQRQQTVYAEANKALFRRFYERAWNDGDPSVVDEALAPAFVNHMLPADTPNHREAYRQAILENRRYFPDYAIMLAALVAEGEHVAAHWRSRCTVGNDAPPDLRPGATLETQGMTLVRIAGGRITEFWKYGNAAAVLAAARTDRDRH